MKTLKFLSAALLGILFSVMTFSMTNTMFVSDTIRIKTDDETEIIIVIPDLSKLKNLEKEISTVMKNLDNVFEKIDAFDTVFKVSVDDNERKIIMEGKKAGETSKIDVKIDTPKTKKKTKNLYGFSSFSLGFNNYLENGAFPNDNKEQYSVKAWGSWDVAIGGGMRWYVAKPLSFDITADVSWYNFKFQDRATRINMDESQNQIVFFEDTLGYDYRKSKLCVPYINASIVPTVHFGKSSSGLNRNMFRLGAGAYAGYRIGGKVKYVFDENNKKSIYKENDDFYLNSYRYGVKLVFGIKEINIYANYDLNTLFAKNKAPELNPISFGLNWKF